MPVNIESMKIFLDPLFHFGFLNKSYFSMTFSSNFFPPHFKERKKNKIKNPRYKMYLL